jgi:hypothetical protein
MRRQSRGTGDMIHDIRFSKGGSSLTAANVRLPARNLTEQKSDKILAVALWGYRWRCEGCENPGECREQWTNSTFRLGRRLLLAPC